MLDLTYETPKPKVIAGANIRLRYQPTIHVAPTVRIHATFDILDNLVLGSLPDGGRITGSDDPIKPDVPKIAFSGSQLPPSGRFGLRLKLSPAMQWPDLAHCPECAKRAGVAVKNARRLPPPKRPSVE